MFAQARRSAEFRLLWVQSFAKEVDAQEKKGGSLDGNIMVQLLLLLLGNRIETRRTPSSLIRKYAARQRLTCKPKGEREGRACRFEARLPRREDQRGKEKGFPDRRVAYRTTHFI